MLHPAAKTALPPTGEETGGEAPSSLLSGALTTMGRPANDFIVETEGLHTGRVAFVLGRRGKNYGNPTITGPSLSVPFRQANQLASFAVGGADVNTMQRMCSFEYLKRYFHHVLKTKKIVVGVNGDFPADAERRGYAKFAKTQVDGKKVTAMNGEAILNAIGQRVRKADSGLANKAKLSNSGIFLADDGPFLRGKTLETEIDRIGRNKSPIASAIGDIVAFDRLQQMITETGACDWVPDGVVHSKLSQGDKVFDDELDSRDGQLFNVTVGGGAITSSWSDDKHMEVLPLDKVFVVIVADVWDNVDDADVDHANYESRLLTKASGKPARDTSEKKDYFDANDKKAVITNMRVRLTTSSEMVSCSQLKDSSKAEFPAAGADAATSRSTYYTMPRDRHNRMGLKLAGNDGVSEYIIGGWCIGTVLDAAAARSSMDGVNLVGAVKRQRTSHASNIKVNVEWWSADRMYRSFMNVNGRIRTRYNGIQNKVLTEMNKSTDVRDTLVKALSRA